MGIAWKKNWDETKQNFRDWWNHNGLVIGMWGAPFADRPHEEIEPPVLLSRATEAFYANTEGRALMNHYNLSKQIFSADMMPIADTMIGPGSLALYLGSFPAFTEDTVWFRPILQDELQPEKLSPIAFNPENRWWRIQEETIKRCLELSRGKYIVGCPDLVENIDILASLRDTTTLLMDMVERPDWVIEKLKEINRVYFDVYNRIYDLIKLEDGSSAFEAYKLWGPGKTAKVQCDISAMFSPAMFERFVVPPLREQCEWLDYSMYHLDGNECLRHLDLLLDIEALDAIEWTPSPETVPGGNAAWYDLYRKILDSGKSVQVYMVWPDEIVPLLDAIGGRGVYILGLFSDEAEVDRVLESVEQFR